MKVPFAAYFAVGAFLSLLSLGFENLVLQLAFTLTASLAIVVFDEVREEA
jgi:hypothetical protein